jgi:hypothetical protein
VVHLPPEIKRDNGGCRKVDTIQSIEDRNFSLVSLHKVCSLKKEWCQMAI